MDEQLNRDYIVGDSSFNNKISEDKETVQDKIGDIQISEVYCPLCNKKIPKNCIFCIHCGHNFSPESISDIIYNDEVISEPLYKQEKNLLPYEWDITEKEKFSPEYYAELNSKIEVNKDVTGISKIADIVCITLSVVIFLFIVYYWDRNFSSVYWNQTPCLRIDTEEEVVSATKSGATMRSYVIYSYKVNGKLYESDHTYIPFPIFGSGRGEPGKDYDKKKPVCYVNPDDPEDAILIKVSPTTFTILYPTIIMGLCGLILFFKGIAFR